MGEGDSFVNRHKWYFMIGFLMIITLLILVIFNLVTANLSTHFVVISTGLNGIVELGGKMEHYLNSLDSKFSEIEKHLGKVSRACNDFMSDHRSDDNHH